MPPKRTKIPSNRPPNLAADRKRALELTSVSRETVERLDTFVALLLRWQASINLISHASSTELWTRHVADSIQLHILLPEARTWIDLGAGAGFPGMPIACALAGKSGAAVHLVERNAKKAAFLREAVRETGVPAIVHCERIEDFTARFAGKADAVTARALAPLDKLFTQAFPLLTKGAVGLFPKGQDVGAELTDAAKCWKSEIELLPSRTDPRARIVIVRDLKKRPKPV